MTAVRHGGYTDGGKMSEPLLILLLSALVALLAAIIGFVLQDNRRLRRRREETDGELNQLRQQWNTIVGRQVEQWKQRELESVIAQQREVALREAQAELVQWKAESVERIRREAITKSRSVTLGKVVEHIAPFFPVFPFNPKDARFIGSPIDFIVFDGASDGEVRRVILLEVKSGGSTLTTKQRRIRDAVRAGKVEWHEFKHSIEDLRSSRDTRR